MTRMPRLVATVAAGALALGLATSGAASAAPTTPVDRSGAWLEDQLTKGLVHNAQYDVDDYGLTVDTAVALAAIGDHDAAVARSTKALAKNVDAYTRGGSEDVYAGATAKLAVFATVVGEKPRRFGGVNLVTRLESVVSSEAATAGRIADKSAYGDYANVLGQAYAVNALRAAGSAKAAVAEKFLLAQQCKAGFFRQSFADPEADDQTCDGAAKADRVPSTDTTAVAVLNLQAIDDPSARVKRAITQGVRWLVKAQGANGSYVADKSITTPNTNSTGLAATALGQAGKCEPAQDAAAWIVKLQRPTGAIAYDRAGFRGKITKKTEDQWRRATAQATPALQYLEGC